MKSKTYLIFSKILKGQEAEKWQHSHLWDRCNVHGDTVEGIIRQPKLRTWEPLEEINYE